MHTTQYLELQGSDPSILVTFYNELFGWEFTKIEEASFEMYSFTAGDLNGTLLKRPGQTPPETHVTNSFMIGIEVEDLVAAAEKINSLGGSTIMERMTMPGLGYRGYFRDSDNNIFSILEFDEHAS